MTDSKPARPAWQGPGIGPENPGTAIAAWGNLVLVGDREGAVHRWNTRTGAVQTTNIGQVCSQSCRAQQACVLPADSMHVLHACRVLPGVH